MSNYRIKLNGKTYEIEVEEISESEAKSASTAKAPAGITRRAPLSTLRTPGTVRRTEVNIP